jgi:hypothetical protein
VKVWHGPAAVAALPNSAATPHLVTSGGSGSDAENVGE